VLFWPEGAEGIRNFTLMLLTVQQSGILTARLILPSGGAVLHPSATAVKALVQSPVVAFNTNLVRFAADSVSQQHKRTARPIMLTAAPDCFRLRAIMWAQPEHQWRLCEAELAVI